jgi:hypothetical protein
MISRMALLKFGLLPLLLLLFVPIAASAVLHRVTGSGDNWRDADRSSAGLLPDPASHDAAVVRVFAARTVRWRGAFAVHSWIVFKPAGAPGYTRYDYTAWGEPIRRDGFVPDGRWFGHMPVVVFAADAEAATAMIPRLSAAIDAFPKREIGDYRAWPGPNSNTFIATILEATPEAGAVLPPNAIGKDFPLDGRWLRATASGTGFRLSLGGYAGLTLGWVEGIELNILASVIGVDIRRPALKLPGLGRIGVPAW